jgi:multiple sugar transport system ATP-binding protein
VTHDQIEALTMADRIGVLKDGRLIQLGTPEDIYDRPATTFVAQLVGTPRINLYKAARDNGTLHIENSTLQVPAPKHDLPTALTLGVRPEDVRISPNGALPGKVALIEPLGVETVIHIRAGEVTLLSLAPGIVSLKPNDEVRFDVLRERLHFFDNHGQRIVV